jgi:hypothetical protein
MDNFHRLAGRVLVTQPKGKDIREVKWTIPCFVELHTSTLNDDDPEWHLSKPAYPESEYIDGVRIVGELSFEDTAESLYRISAGTGSCNPCFLELWRIGDHSETSKLPIVFFDKVASTVSINKNYRRHTWQFTTVGPPVHDSLELLPKNYCGSTQLRVFSCVDFRGNWPRPVSAIVVARSRSEARKILKKELESAGVPLEGDGGFTMREMPTGKAAAFIFVDGNN